MGSHEVKYEPDLRCYPNYSFEIGDVDGDGRQEMVSLNQNGNRLRVVDLFNEIILQVKLKNNGNWGTPIPALLDLDGDGREEVVVPSFGNRFESRIVAINAEGEKMAERSFGTYRKDDYGIGVPLLSPLCRKGEGGVVAAISGGEVAAMDADLDVIWRVGGFRNDFGHEFYLADIDGDAHDEIAFCTMDHVNLGYEDGTNIGELVVLDHDGTTLLRRRVDEYFPDTHFDDVAMADFRGRGKSDILVEKGVLLNLDGEVIWDLSDEFDHGQWIAHAPGNRGRMIFISELWGWHGKSALISGTGEKLMEIRDLPLSELDSSSFPGWHVLPTRCHMVSWSRGDPPEIFLAEQTCGTTSHDCFETRRFDLKAFFLDLDGSLIDSMPFADAQIEGYWYNGEVRSRVADVDGDGEQEVVFPRQDGHVMVIGRDG
ncbi:MAG: VCBS repeat-containing protein [Theionarchaea archaeon]|nr:VCBS repeat-containing protein [Theionarchaea archaeon]